MVVVLLPQPSLYIGKRHFTEARAFVCYSLWSSEIFKNTLNYYIARTMFCVLYIFRNINRTVDYVILSVLKKKYIYTMIVPTSHNNVFTGSFLDNGV